MATLTSVQKTSSAVILAERGIFGGLSIKNADGAAIASVVIYDNATTNSGTVLGEAAIMTGHVHASVIIPEGVSAKNGIYAAITGTANVVVYFKKSRY